MDARELLAELKRRRVVRAALVYAAGAFAALQAAAVLVPALHLPGWITTVAVIAIAGFPLVMALAWAVDISGGGIRVTPRHDAARRATPPPALLGRGTLLVTGALALAGVAFGAGWVLGPDARAEARAPVTGRLSVAVLPFADLSDDRSQEYFGDGIAEELLNTLRTSDVEVASRSSSFAFKGRRLGAREIAQQLGVDHIIEGSVRKAGDRLRISAQLIDIRADRQLWAQSFDRHAGDIFSIQDEIARAVASALRVRLASGAGVAGTRDAEAYDLYLLGLYYWNQRSADGLQRALDVFRAAAERDPGFARAWAGLSLTYGTLPGYTRFDGELARRESRAAAEHAVRLDPTSAEARTALGGALRNDGDLAAARRELERAIELDSTFATAHHWLGMAHTRDGRLDEAEAALRRSLALDPASLAAQSYLALILEFQRRTEEALAETEALLARAPDYRNGLIHAFVLAATLRRAREYEPRLAAYLRVVGEDPAQARTIVAAIEQEALRTEAVAALHAIERRGLATGRVARRHELLVLIGAHEEALQLLEREPIQPVFLHTRTFDPLRSDPRFRALVLRSDSVRVGGP